MNQPSLSDRISICVCFLFFFTFSKTQNQKFVLDFRLLLKTAELQRQLLIVLCPGRRLPSSDLCVQLEYLRFPGRRFAFPPEGFLSSKLTGVDGGFFYNHTGEGPTTASGKKKELEHC